MEGGAKTLYEVFEYSVKKHGHQRCLGWRPMTGGKPGPYEFWTYSETRGAQYAPLHHCAASYEGPHLYRLNTNDITPQPKPFSQQNTPLGLLTCMSLPCGPTACVFCAAERAAVLAAAIKAAGVKAGGRVGIYAPNVPNWMLVIQACNRSSLQVGEPSWTASTALCSCAPSRVLLRSTL